MQHIDLGKLSNLSFPATDTHRTLWPLYSGAIGLTDTPVDTMLVDGRFLVACAMQAWLTQPATTFIMIHDYRDRAYYHDLERWCAHAQGSYKNLLQ
jgi:hypothetical protein